MFTSGLYQNNLLKPELENEDPLCRRIEESEFEGKEGNLRGVERKGFVKN
jgi:hypothetical protein